MRINKNGQFFNTKPDINGMMACAYDTFNPLTMTFDLTKSKNTSCYPSTQQFVAIVRKQYYSGSSVTNASSCTRGLDALEMLQWLFTNKDIDALTNSVNIGRLSNVAGVENAYINALNGAVCDNETLLITLPIIWSLSSGLQGFGFAAAIIGFVLTSLLMAFTIVYHRHPIIRSSSPMFMLISLFGVMLLFIGAVALVTAVSDASCSTLSWLINLGIIVTFAPLFAKTWRIYRIFGRRKLSVVKISNRKLLFIVIVLFAMETIIMIVWQALSPLQPIIASTMEGSPSRVHQYEQCGVEGDGSAMFAVVAVEKGVLLLFGALMAFSTRRVSSQFNESSQIALAIYNVVFSIGIIAPIIVVINATGDVLTALLLFVLLWIAFFTACILVIPKALHILSPQSAEQNNNSVAASSGNSQSGYSFLSMDILSTVAVATGYLAALRKHIEGVEKHISSMKRSAGRESVAQNKSMEKSLVDKHDNYNHDNHHNNHASQSQSENSVSMSTRITSPLMNNNNSNKCAPGINRALHNDTAQMLSPSSRTVSTVAPTASVNSVNVSELEAGRYIPGAHRTSTNNNNNTNTYNSNTTTGHSTISNDNNKEIDEQQNLNEFSPPLLARHSSRATVTVTSSQSLTSSP